MKIDLGEEVTTSQGDSSGRSGSDLIARNGSFPGHCKLCLCLRRYVGGQGSIYHFSGNIGSQKCNCHFVGSAFNLNLVCFHSSPKTPEDPINLTNDIRRHHLSHLSTYFLHKNSHNYKYRFNLEKLKVVSSESKTPALLAGPRGEDGRKPAVSLR